VLTSGLTGSRIRLALLVSLVTLAALAGGALAVFVLQPLPSSYAAAPDGPLVQQLAGEVSDARAMKHLQALQKIADEHGGNRAAGTSGYDASVDYVAGVLRGAGFKVSTPTYEASGHHGRRTSGAQRNVIAQTLATS